MEEADALIEMYRTQVLPLADLIVPNMFEALALTGSGKSAITSQEEAYDVCRQLHAMAGGKAAVVVTGLDFKHAHVRSTWEQELGEGIPDWTQSHNAAEWAALPHSYGLRRALTHMHDMSTGHPSVQSVAYMDASGLSFGIVDSVKLPSSFAGAGDLFAALLAYHFWAGVPEGKLSRAVEQSTHTVHDVLRHSLDEISATPNPTPGALLDIDIISAKDLILRASHGSGHPHVSSSRPLSTQYTKLRGVIFDMDGTLTEAGAIDFTAMFARTGLDPKGGDILTQVHARTDLSSSERELMLSTIVQVEREANAVMQLQPGTAALLHWLHERGVPIAISTRNCLVGIGRLMELLHAAFTEEGLGPLPAGLFHPIVTRDCLGGRNKPSGTVAAAILSTWGIAPTITRVANGTADGATGCASSTLFVGDSYDDIKCGAAAGMQTCFVANNDSHHASANHSVTRLDALLPVIERAFALDSDQEHE